MPLLNNPNIYNPKDCWHRPLFFIFTDMSIRENPKCALLDSYRLEIREEKLEEYRKKTQESMRKEAQKDVSVFLWFMKKKKIRDR